MVARPQPQRKAPRRFFLHGTAISFSRLPGAGTQQRLLPTCVRAAPPDAVQPVLSRARVVRNQTRIHWVSPCPRHACNRVLYHPSSHPIYDEFDEAECDEPIQASQWTRPEHRSIQNSKGKHGLRRNQLNQADLVDLGAKHRPVAMSIRL